MTQQNAVQAIQNNEVQADPKEGLIAADAAKGEAPADLSVCAKEDLTFEADEIADIKLENDTLIITLKDGSEVTIENFKALMAATGMKELVLADGTVVDLSQYNLANAKLGERAEDGGQQGEAGQAEEGKQGTKGEGDVAQAPGEETLQAVIQNGDQDESIAEDVVANLAKIETAAGQEPDKVIIAETNKETNQTEVIAINTNANQQDNLADIAQKLAQVEPAAGNTGGAGAGGRGGYGFDSSADPVSISALNAIGPINATALQYGITPPQNDRFFFVDPLVAPLLDLNGGVDNAIVKEDGSIFIPITATLQGPDVANQVLTVTISGVDAATAATGGFLPTAVPGVYSQTLPAGTNYNGGITVTPAAQSDVDLGQFSVVATASNPSTGEVESVSDDATVITDAVADKPNVDGDDASTFVNNALDVDVTGSLGVDGDGSETITGYQITSGTGLSGFTFSAGSYDPVTNILTLTPADLVGLQVTPPTGFVGSVDLTVTIFNEETNLSDTEVDYIDNTNSNTDTFTLSWVKGPVITYDFSNEVDGNTGLVKEDGSLNMDLNVDIGDTAGPVAGDEVLTVTISGIDPAWNVTLPGQSGAVWTSTGTPGEFSITLPAGESYTGVLTFVPPAQSDVDHPQITITASVNDPVLGDSASDSDVIDIVTDAVADLPNVDGDDASTFVNNALDVDVTGSLGVDGDGSETITGYQITSGTGLSGFTFSAGSYDPVTNILTLTPADLVGLQVTPPTGFVGSVDLTVTIFNEETNLSDTEVDYIDNTNSNTDTFTLSWVKGPVITYDFSNEVDGNTGLVKEDSSVTLNLQVDNVAGVGPVSGDEVLTVTISNLDPTWTINLPGQSGAVWTSTGTPGEFSITLPAGESYTGAITFAPPADSDLDHPTFTITASVNDPVLAITETASATGDILTDAVIDTPVLNVEPASGEEGTTVSLNISAAIGETAAYISESITSITLSGLPAGATLNHGSYDAATGTWTLTSADLSGLEINIPDGVDGVFSLAVTLTTQENVTAGDPANGEVDFSDNTAVITRILKLTVTEDTVPTIHPEPITVDEENLPGPLVQTGNLNVDFGDDTAGSTIRVTTTVPTGLTASGQTVTVVGAGNVYTGTNENGNTVFTLTLNSNGTYTYEQFLPLDHAEGTATDDTLPLIFGVKVTDGDGDEAISEITVNVIDDNPVAHDDENCFSSDQNTTHGNVITGDNGLMDRTDTDIDDQSNDTPNTIISVDGVVLPTDGSYVDIAGTYGTLHINNTGDYTYTLFDGLPYSLEPYAFTNTESFPALPEGVVMTNPNKLGVDAGDLDINFDATGSVKFVSEGAGYNNTLGQFYISNDGSLMSADIIIKNINNVDDGETVTEFDINGSNSEGIGFFIIANGFSNNAGYSGLDLNAGSLNFIYKYGTADERVANVSDNGGQISLVFTATNGTETVLKGPVYFTTERGSTENLNADSSVRVVSGLPDTTDPTVLRIGFEDLPKLGDKDYNDVVFDVTIKRVLEEKVTDQFDYVLQDGDGDTDGATLTVCIENSPKVDVTVQNGVNDVLVKEDGSVFVAINANVTGGDGNEVMKLTLTGVETGWGVNGAGWVATGTPGEYVITLVAGERAYNGGITFTPPANSDVDLRSLNVEASVFNPDTSTTQTDGDGFNIIVDAVADAPTLSVTLPTSSANTGAGQRWDIIAGEDITQWNYKYVKTGPSYSFDLAANVTDTDGSESITHFTVKIPESLANFGVTFNHGTEVSNGVWDITVAEAAGLKIEFPVFGAGMSYKYPQGIHDFVVTAYSKETNLSGQEHDYSDNRASTTQIVEVTIVSSPLVLDLDRDGIELTPVEKGVSFDMDNDGLADKTGWVDSDDGFLALDINGDGVINNQSELFGDTIDYANGFANLSQYDTNSDGVINSEDSIWADLVVWQDQNQDGVSQGAEMFSLDHFGIAGINLAAQDAGLWQDGNFISHTGTFVYNDGQEGEIVDAWFSFYNQASGSTELVGDEGQNALYGSQGDDVLIGKGGNDVLYGDNGADIFVFDSFNGTDSVLDFKAGEDTLDFSAMIEEYDPTTNAITDFIKLTETGADTVVSIDMDGAGATAGFENVVILKDVIGLDVDDLVNNGSLVA